MSTRRFAVSTVVLTLALAGAATPLGGCAGTPEPVATQEVRDQNRARGQELALEAQRLANLGKKAEAIKAYQQALGTWREMPAAWNNLGVLLMERENYAEAVSAFKVAADQSQTDPRPLENIAICYMRAGWAEDALRYYGMALEREPNRLTSLRGAVRAAERLLVRDDATLDRIRRALMIETDPKYRDYFERQQVLVRAAVDPKLK